MAIKSTINPKRNTTSVSAVIVTWNSERDIKDCIQSLIDQTHKLDEIIVIDNASSDNTVSLISSSFLEVKVIKESINWGFAKGNNIGIRELHSDWVLTLNPDARIEEDYIENLLDEVSSSDNVGAAGGKILSENHPQIIDTIGIEIFRSRRVRDRGMGMVDNGQFEKNENVFGVCAAAALYRREMLVDVSIDGEVFPERFFAYYEDADLAWRAWRRGWICRYVPNAVGWHRRGGSPVGGKFSRSLTHRNRLWLLARNESFMSLARDFIPILLHEFLMVLRIIRYPYLIKSVLESIIGLRKALHDRKRLKSKVKTPPPYKAGIGFGKSDKKKSTNSTVGTIWV